MRRTLLIGLAACSFQGSGEPPPPTSGTDAMSGAWDAWQFRRRIEVKPAANTGDTLVDFPVLITLRPDFDYAHLAPNGDDIRFVTDDGQTLPYDLDTLAPSDTSWLWVRVTIDPAAPPRFWMYYGNPEAPPEGRATVPWNGHSAVYHLGDLADATDHHLDGMPTMQTMDTAGQIGRARKFTGNENIVLPDQAQFAFTTTMTASLWMSVERFDSDWQAILCKGDSTWRIHRAGGSSHAAFSTSANGQANDDLNSIADVTLNTWHHLAAVYDGGLKTLYLDGNVASSNFTGPIIQNDDPVVIGDNPPATGNRHFKGSIDEVRLTSMPRAKDWIVNEVATAQRADFAPLGPPMPVR